jgi:hypothetical protein
MVANDVVKEEELERLTQRIKNRRAGGRSGSPPEEM